MLQVLWRRRGTMIVSILLCIALACLYLRFAVPVYSVTARIRVTDVPLEMKSGEQQNADQSQIFVQAQTTAIVCTPVVRQALDSIDYHQLQTFAGAAGDPVAWLRQTRALSAEAMRRSDVILLSLETRFPDEGSRLVNAIVDAYRADLASNARRTAQQLEDGLAKESQKLYEEELGKNREIVEWRSTNNSVAYVKEWGNEVYDRLAKLTAALTDAEAAVMQLDATRAAVLRAKEDPAKIPAIVESLRTREKDWQDQELSAMRSQLAQLEVSRTSMAQTLGPANPRFQQTERGIDALKRQIADTEKRVVDGYLLSLDEQLTTAREQERGLRSSLDQQRGLALKQGNLGLNYTALINDAERLRHDREQIQAQISALEVRTTEAVALGTQVLEAATYSISPVKPNRPLVLGLAAMTGWLLGMGFALFRDARDQLLRTPAEIWRDLGIVVTAAIPSMSRRLPQHSRGIVMLLEEGGEIVESFRELRTSLQFGAASGARVITVTSPTSQEGKSTVASNLAVAMAQSGENVLLIDANLRRPTHHRTFRLPPRHGLAGVLDGTSTVPEAIQSTEVPGLFVCPAGHATKRPSDLLANWEFRVLMSELRAQYGLILIDTPAMKDHADARAVATASDGVLMVLRSGKTKRDPARIALSKLAQVGIPLVGVVANHSKSQRIEVPFGVPYGVPYGPLQFGVGPGQRSVPEFAPAVGTNGHPVERLPASQTESKDELGAFMIADGSAGGEEIEQLPRTG